MLNRSFDELAYTSQPCIENNYSSHKQKTSQINSGKKWQKVKCWAIKCPNIRTYILSNNKKIDARSNHMTLDIKLKQTTQYIISCND